MSNVTFNIHTTSKTCSSPQQLTIHTCSTFAKPNSRMRDYFCHIINNIGIDLRVWYAAYNWFDRIHTMPCSGFGFGLDWGAFSKMYSIVRPIQAAILKLSEPYNLVSVFFVAILFRLFKLYLYSKFILVTKWFVFWPLTGASVLMIWILVLVKAFKLRFFIHIQIQLNIWFSRRIFHFEQNVNC